MLELLLALARHLARRAVVIALVVAVTVLVAAAGIAAHAELARVERERLVLGDAVERATRELDAARDEARRLAGAAELAARRAAETARQAEELRGLVRRLLQAVGLADEEQARLAALERQQAEIESQRARLGGRLEALARLASDHEAALAAARARLAELEGRDTAWRAFRARAEGYLREAWLAWRWPLAWTVAALVAGPTLWRLFLYFAWAPLLARAAPVRLAGPGETAPQVVAAGPGGVSAELPLAPGDEVLAKERFLQSSDEGLRRRTRFVLDWRHPLTSASAGLVELVSLEAPDGPPGTPPHRVTFSTMDEATTELLAVDVPAGVELVLRPRHVAALVRPRGGDPAGGRFRAAWRLGSLHAWITFQFRFFLVRGPVRLVLWGNRGVRLERVAAGRGRRTNARCSIGFSPALAFHSVRAETFWGYYRGMNPLFDDHFSGDGVFLCEEVSSVRGDGPARFWRALWDGLLKVFGL